MENSKKLSEEEINELKLKIDNLTNNKSKLVDFNQIRVVQFISDDNYSLICGINCLPSDTFAELEEKLYKIYRELRELMPQFSYPITTNIDNPIPYLSGIKN